MHEQICAAWAVTLLDFTPSHVEIDQSFNERKNIERKLLVTKHVLHIAYT